MNTAEVDGAIVGERTRDVRVGCTVQSHHPTTRPKGHSLSNKEYIPTGVLVAQLQGMAHDDLNNPFQGEVESHCSFCANSWR